MFACAFLAPFVSLTATAAERTLLLNAAKVYPAPDMAPIEDAVIVMRDGRITQVVERDRLPEMEGTVLQACSGGIVMAGFQNNHVHLLGDDFFAAHEKSDAELSDGLERMLTRSGFTTVVDTASEPANTRHIRQRIEASAVRGPRILTVGPGVFPPDGLPIYIAHLPSSFLRTQLQPESAHEARRQIASNLDAGADATKLFVATPQADGSLKRMSLETARAAAQASHERDKLVMVHPTDLEGLRLALDAGADILVHTTLGSEAPWPTDVLQRLLADNVAIAPTFKLLGYELSKENVPADIARRLILAATAQFEPFVKAGGTVLFGTDVGYMTDFDPTDEYVLMAQAGMTPMQILASLTTAPAQVWGEAAWRGRVLAGMEADLVVLRSDPSSDVRHFADVRCTIRSGKLVYGE